MPARRPAFALGGRAVEAGTRETVDIPVGALSDHTPVTMSAHVLHGARDGPVAFVSAGIHGDEVVGVEVARRLIKALDVRRIRGTVMIVPIVNAYGFIARSRYLPDRRDLNRCFPGSADGSLGARLARLFLNEIVTRASVGIDLHSAAIHRTNLPQVRIPPGNERVRDLAAAFGAPVVLTSPLREGSLRLAAQEKGVDVLLYEAGEGLRFDETSVRTGVSGVLRILKREGLLTGRAPGPPKVAPVHAGASRWLRAPQAGLLRRRTLAGRVVEKNELLGSVFDPFGESVEHVHAAFPGVVIGAATMPVVNAGDALFHIARVDTDAAAEAVDGMAEAIEDDLRFYEDEL